MRGMSLLAALAVLLLLIPGRIAAQARTIRIDDFEPGMESWTAMTIGAGGLQPDAKAKVALTQDPARVKTGKSALSYTYPIEAGNMSLLTLAREFNAPGMKSLSLWAQAGDTTALVITLGEKGGASYQTTAYCPAGSWQEVTVNLSDFRRDGDAQDANGRLDSEEVASITVMDVGGMLVNLLPELKGQRTLFLDEVKFSATPAPTTLGVIKPETGPAMFRVDNFESPVIRWIPVTLEIANGFKFVPFQLPLRIDSDAAPSGGKGSLQLNYTREQGKIPALTRSLEREQLEKATGLSLWIKTSRDGAVMLTLEEKDGSRFQQLVELKAGDGWKQLNLPLTSFTLADDSKDENNRVDAGQLKDLGLLDPAGILGADLGQSNTLWLDEIHFSFGG